MFTLSIKNKVNLKIGNWNLFSQNFDIIKKSVGNIFDIFSDGTCRNKIHLTYILKTARTSLYVHCLSVLIVSDNRCVYTAERIQITTMN